LQIDAQFGFKNERFTQTNYNLILATQRFLELAHLTGDKELM
jgi:hypothetical protein